MNKLINAQKRAYDEREVSYCALAAGDTNALLAVKRSNRKLKLYDILIKMVSSLTGYQYN